MRKNSILMSLMVVAKLTAVFISPGLAQPEPERAIALANQNEHGLLYLTGLQTLNGFSPFLQNRHVWTCPNMLGLLAGPMAYVFGYKNIFFNKIGVSLL